MITVTIDDTNGNRVTSDFMDRATHNERLEGMGRMLTRLEAMPRNRELLVDPQRGFILVAFLNQGKPESFYRFFNFEQVRQYELDAGIDRVSIDDGFRTREAITAADSFGWNRRRDFDVREMMKSRRSFAPTEIKSVIREFPLFDTPAGEAALIQAHKIEPMRFAVSTLIPRANLIEGEAVTIIGFGIGTVISGEVHVYPEYI